MDFIRVADLRSHLCQFPDDAIVVKRPCTDRLLGFNEFSPAHTPQLVDVSTVSPSWPPIVMWFQKARPECSVTKVVVL